MFTKFPIVGGWRVYALSLAMAGMATASGSSMPNYFMRVWQVEDGLPQNSVTSVHQTRDGYIWAGTYNGLVRFDGVHFTVFDSANTPEMKSSRVTSLLESPDGTLWIGHESGELTCFKSNRFEAVDFRANWVSHKISNMGLDESGMLWLVSPEGLLSRFSDGRTFTPAVGQTRGNVRSASAQGKIWVGRNGILSELAGGKLRVEDFGEPAGSGAAHYVHGICPSQDGGLWLADNGALRKWNGKAWVENRGRTPWATAPATCMLETRSGLLAAGTADGGLYLMAADGNTIHYTRTNGFPSDWVESLCEDREGDLWVGTHGGLVMLRESIITNVNPPDQWQGRPVMSVTTGSNGVIWASTEGAGLYRLKGVEWSHFGKEDGLPSLYVWSAAEDESGRLWGGVWGSGGFIQVEGGRFEKLPPLDGNLSMVVLLHLGQDEVLVGTTEGLLHYNAGKTNWLVRAGEFATPDIRAVVREKDGTLWFGTFGSGLGRLKDGQLRHYGKADGLPNEFVQCLRVDDDGTLWIGTLGGGLARLKHDRLAAISTPQGLANGVICHIEEDAAGFFWMSSHAGIMRASKAELGRCADGLITNVFCRRFDMSDGMPTVECSGGMQPSGCRSADGRLWFPTTKGLVAIDPGKVRTNEVVPPVVIEALVVDDHVATAKGSTLEIPPGRHRVELQYTGLSFAVPERVRFKYRLSNLDKSWMNAGTKRVATYNYIPPGEYVFHVAACNNDGVWNEAGAQMAFTVQPYFWQTLWFRIFGGIATACAGGVIVWLDGRRRMRLKLERIERQRAVEHERTRIAHDIHDDLGAHLTRIGMLSDPARFEQRGLENAAADLGRIYGTTLDLTRAMGEIVWAVNPQHDNFDSLVDYLHKFAQDFLEDAGIRCRVDVPMELSSWVLSAEVRHNVFLAFKETLNNIVKHAGASEVHIQVTVEPSAFTLIVEDDGRGFVLERPGAAIETASEPMDHGNGLRNMKTRLSEIGGVCQVESTPGSGTRVTFTLRVKAVSI